MYKYKDKIKFNYDFKRSINITLNNDNCHNYKLTNLTSTLIDSFLTQDYSTNSFALIGSFGTGKSAFLLYLELLLKKDITSIAKLKEMNDTYQKYHEFIQNRDVCIFKFTGEFSSFRDFFKNSFIENYTEFSDTISYLKQDDYTVEGVLKVLEKEVIAKGYSDIFFLFDEFGKLLSYGLNISNKNDMSDLQIFSEYANNSNNIKLIITLHRNIKDYANNAMSLNYNEWTKVQGRFETIIFEYEFLELINIVSDSFCLEPETVQQLSDLLEDVFNSDQDIFFLERYQKLFPLHPFTTLMISHLFSKYFQNNRSIYSFLFSNESYSFNEFINQEYEKLQCYTLSNLYDYMFYLSRAYEIRIPNREVWYLSSEYIHKHKFLPIEVDIVKVIALVQSYKMESYIKLDRSNIYKSVLDKYSKTDVNIALNELVKKNIISVNPYKAFALINESNIDIYKEVSLELSALGSINHLELINKLNIEDKVLAKKFFVIYGNRQTFTKKVVLDPETKIKYHILFLNNVSADKILNLSYQNQDSIYVNLHNMKDISHYLNEIEVLKKIQLKHRSKLTAKSNLLIMEMVEDKESFVQSFFKFDNKSEAFHNGCRVKFDSKTIQKIMTDILVRNFRDTPQINNYTFNHSSGKGQVTAILRRLFVAMLKNSDKQNLGIEKYPPEKALYLSVVKLAGMHEERDNCWYLKEPDSLNFGAVWNFLKKRLVEKQSVLNLIDILDREPFGLSQDASLLIISLFIIINQNEVFAFRENTYKYTITDDLLINLIKDPKKYDLKYLVISESEKKLFEAYLRITNEDTSEYSRANIKNVITKIYQNFEKLPSYSKNTQKLSDTAIKLRKTLYINKTPHEGLFERFPKDLGYQDLSLIDQDEYILRFKKYFNEIVSSYKDMIVRISLHISKVFKLEVTHYPYNNEFKNFNSLLTSNKVSTKLKKFLNIFLTTNSLREFINGLSIMINEKRIDDCYDSDIRNLKRHLEILARELLSSIDLICLSRDSKEVRRVKLSLLDKDIDRTIIIENTALSRLNHHIKKIKDVLPKNLSKDERLYIISEFIKDENGE